MWSDTIAGKGSIEQGNSRSIMCKAIPVFKMIQCGSDENKATRGLNILIIRRNPILSDWVYTSSCWMPMEKRKPQEGGARLPLKLHKPA